MKTFKQFFIEAGLAAGKTVQDIAKKHNVDVSVINSQLKMGIKVEHEHTKDNKKARIIAMDHLFEDPHYYSKLNKMEKVSESKQKHSKEEAGYVAHTVKGQRCDQCTMWRAPNKCSAVAGDIKPEAWCKWWKKSKRKDLVKESRTYIDWDKNYGKTFKLVHTPEGQQSQGAQWSPDLVSVVTPENGNAWKTWKEVPSNILANWKSNWNNIQSSLGQHKYDQIIRSQKSLHVEKSIHDPVRPGILKRQTKGKMTCSKARSLKAKQKNKGNHTAKAAQRYLNYHC